MYSRLLAALFKRNSISQKATRLQRRTMKTAQESELKDEPIKYSTSEAGKWKAAYSTSGKDYFDTPRIQPLVVVVSLTAFMVYFCILREENDLDDWMKNVEKQLPLAIEEAELKSKIQHAKQTNRDPTHYENKLHKIMELREKLNTLK